LQPAAQAKQFPLILTVLLGHEEIQIPLLATPEAHEVQLVAELEQVAQLVLHFTQLLLASV
jgi:hypothetical protein